MARNGRSRRTIGVSLPRETIAWLNTEAQRRGMGRSELIRRLVLSARGESFVGKPVVDKRSRPRPMSEV